MGGSKEMKVEIDKLDADMAEEIKAAKIQKILILGPGESGKSTVLKQLQLHREKLTAVQIKSCQTTLYHNALQCMGVLINQCEQRGLKFTEEGQQAVDRLMKSIETEDNETHGPLAVSSRSSLSFMGESIDPQNSKDVTFLWTQDCVQEAYTMRGEFWILDSADYYFDKMQHFTSKDWVPTNTEIAMARDRTTGVIESEFERHGLGWQVVDVGGQRSERKKWVNCFADVSAIVFMCNLAGYNSVLYEDQKINRMQECLQLYKDTLDHEIFRKTPVFLFLNKRDIFEEMLETVDITKNFPAYKGDPKDSAAAIAFIISEFETRQPTLQRESLKSWTLTARSGQEVRYAFMDIQDILEAKSAAALQQKINMIKEKYETEKAVIQKKYKHGLSWSGFQKMLGLKKRSSEVQQKSDIDRMLEEEHLKEELHFKMICLGPGESGKSTVIKQLRIIHKKKLDSRELDQYRLSLQSNALQSMDTVLKAGVKFGFELDEDVKALSDKITAAWEAQAEDSDFAFTPELAETIQALWKTDVVKSIYKRRNEYWLLDGASHYFDRCDVYAEEDFVPTEEDVVMARARTTGIVTTEFDQGVIHWSVVDVGGQRSERKKWMHVFDDVKAVVFVVNLSGYNSVLFEDESVNRMHEALELFKGTVNQTAFRDKPVYLLLNKKDLFEQVLKDNPITKCFPNFTGGTSASAAIHFIGEQFTNQLAPERRSSFQYWAISARYKRDVKYAFLDLQDFLMKRKENKTTVEGTQKAMAKINAEKEKERLKEEQRLALNQDEQLELEKIESYLKFKILCLGPGESGKSTLIKQLKIIHHGLNDKEINDFARALRNNAIQCMEVLIRNAKNYGLDFEESEQKYADLVIETADSDDPELTLSVAVAIEHLWSSEAIQLVYEKKSEFWLLENAAYYFKHCKIFARDDFVPSEVDIVMTRARTTGITNTALTSPPHQWDIVDVGGQRSERKKWMNVFGGVNAILFIVNLSGYASVLFEDSKVNRMTEAMTLFEETVNRSTFKDTPIYLYLNKKDLFERRLRTIPLTTLFPDYNESTKDDNVAIEFIASKFKELLPAHKKDSFEWWSICAQLKRDVKYGFLETVESLLEKDSVKENLQKYETEMAEFKAKKNW